MTPLFPSDPLTQLQTRLGEEWPAINSARARARTASRKLEGAVRGLTSADTGIVVFGSLARQEWTSKSDVDWTLLVDGQAHPEHFDVAQKIESALKRAEFKEPGTTGIFGNMAFSHDLVQKIGGTEDTNENTTRRVLLLLESLPFGKPDAYNRVLRLILSRYLDEDWGFKFGSLPVRVPRFLFNDIVRYWRTITVDFVDKQRRDAGRGWGLRNAKLRMSRKLLFAAGMLSCFSCEFFCSSTARRELIKQHSTVAFEEHLRTFVRKTPLEILAIFLIELKIKPKTVIKLLSSYNEFLSLLNSAVKRQHLKELQPLEFSSDSVFRDVQRISREFQEGLTALFFHDDERLRELTVFYGVF